MVFQFHRCHLYSVFFLTERCYGHIVEVIDLPFAELPFVPEFAGPSHILSIFRPMSRCPVDKSVKTEKSRIFNKYDKNTKVSKLLARCEPCLQLCVRSVASLVYSCITECRHICFLLVVSLVYGCMYRASPFNLIDLLPGKAVFVCISPQFSQ